MSALPTHLQNVCRNMTQFFHTILYTTDCLHIIIIVINIIIFAKYAWNYMIPQNELPQ